ncbi:MAG: tail fiber protein [Dokdonella sp.]
MPTPFVAQISPFGFNFAPRGWALCDGQLLPINQNQALFSLLGTTYGGNGTTNFALPDLRGRTPMGATGGSGTTVLGSKLGVESVTLAATELPTHAHAARAAATAPASGSPASNAWAAGSPAAYASSANTSMSPSALASVGGSQPHENRGPSQVLNYCIALQGVFPSRN